MTVIWKYLPLLGCICLAGCTVATQVTCDLDYRFIGDLTEASLRENGIGVLTPSIVTGRETDKQIIGEVLSDVLESRLDDRSVVSLVELINFLNIGGLADLYASALEMYERTGVIPSAPLGQLGTAAGVRYLAKLSLANFEQSQIERFGIAGVRVLSTNRTRIRLFLEIWDSTDGKIIWYANEELNIASDQAAEDDLSVRGAATRAIQQMIDTILARSSDLVEGEVDDLACTPTES